MKKTVLVCDDERHMQRLLEFNLKKTACNVLTASSGQEVLSLMESQPIDLLIIDVMMPEMDGFETIQKVRQTESGTDVPIIILTGRGQSNTRQQADALHLSGFLNKPFSPIKLQQMVLELIGQ